ncbi:hypothetical protein [Escherichia coli]|uniref:hypothetical protein n=1 Tax=Escherichia coli TaxID=562 RepID=UPI00039AB277
MPKDAVALGRVTLQVAALKEPVAETEPLLVWAIAVPEISRAEIAAMVILFLENIFNLNLDFLKFFLCV